MRFRVLCLALAATACGDYPRDTAGTREAVQERPMRIGREAGTAPGPDLEAFLHRLADRTGSRPAIVPGPSESLLLWLEAGKLDLVVGTFDGGTPWAKRVTFSRPIAHTAHGEVKAASRNGEHRWAMEIDRAVLRR